ncbi:MAG: class I SAM-dependent methyltransferase, partial [Acidobacteriota bacterium]
AFNAASARLGSRFWADLDRHQSRIATAESDVAALQKEVPVIWKAMQNLRAETAVAVENAHQQAAALRSEVAALQKQHQAALEAIVDTIRAEMRHLDAHHQHGMTSLSSEVESLVARLERDVDMLRREQIQTLHDIERRHAGRVAAGAATPAVSVAPLDPGTGRDESWMDPLLATFEDAFRGTRAQIKERLSVYRPYASAARKDLGAIDLGCGRGEWLEILKEEGVRGTGVESNCVLVEECRALGLEVVEGDALRYLATVPDGTLTVVTGFHIVEHVPLATLVRMLDETVRALASGGVAIFETPNPGNVLVGSHTFYLDPTHRNPIPIQTLTFLAQARGLRRIEVKELHPITETPPLAGSDADTARRLNEYLYGPRDYSIVGFKD